METFILERLATQWPLLLGLIIGIVFFVRLKDGQTHAAEQLENFITETRENWNKIDKRMLVLEAKLEVHVASAAPHSACAAEATAVIDMCARLDRVQKGIGRLETWVMYIATNKATPPPGEDM